MRIGSSQPGGGQIIVQPEFDFASDVFYVPLAAQAGGSTLYSDIFPSFAWILTAGDGIHPLNEDVEVDFTVAAPISAGASVRLATRTLDAPGEAVGLGAFENDPEAHVHPEWRLLLPNGVTGQYEVSFRLSAAGFADSPVYTLLITNEEPAATPTASATVEPSAEPTAAEPTATATATATGEATAEPTATAEPPATETPEATPTGATEPTATATATPTASATRTHTSAAPACAGDCDGNGSVSIAELVRAVGLALDGGTSTCAAADINGNGSIAINELIRAVGSALEGCNP